MNLLKLIEEKEKNLFKKKNNFSSGDIVSLDLFINEKKKSQNFTGIIIAKKNKGLNSSFMIKKISDGIKIIKIIPIYSPIIKSIKILNKIKKKKSKLYYLIKK